MNDGNLRSPPTAHRPVDSGHWTLGTGHWTLDGRSAPRGGLRATSCEQEEQDCGVNVGGGNTFTYSTGTLAPKGEKDGQTESSMYSTHLLLTYTGGVAAALLLLHILYILYIHYILYILYTSTHGTYGDGRTNRIKYPPTYLPTYIPTYPLTEGDSLSLEGV
ncbi:hypothetical protein BZA05DRAFT_28059 [Tricharina praecox]|uniref:uncharacterized protein n=1 Tax=Tricharina praecox TaxID=43433 RepID=UPI0022201C6C|nr:uncharacterized protein BZA05DRAFT_28059 [Tricharina praecox]KAI5853400.1 hypothetical protein BZA05DRAFT_28059 [Tricharina praecox]